MPGYKNKSEAEREAINERARNWPRPLSVVQRNALIRMSRSPLQYSPIRTACWGGLFMAATIDALSRRGLCRIEGKQRMRADITAKGRRAIGRTA